MPTEDETLYELYETKSGETWDSIAFDLFTNEMMASTLIQENKEYADVLIFDGGEVLAIPIVNEENEEDSIDTIPPWRQ